MFVELSHPHGVEDTFESQPPVYSVVQATFVNDDPFTQLHMLVG